MKTIMIVDEEPDMLKQLKGFLQTEGVTVVTASNSRQALGNLKEENEETFDLILVNTKMPGSKKTTALFSMKPQMKKQSGGVEDFLQKPFTKDQFLAFVKEKMKKG
jgi:DNA-binding response OmpR family regulator